MEIDITRFVETADPHDFSASQAELGVNARKITWNNATREGEESPLLTTAEHFRAMRSWAKEFGAWSEAEIAAWSPAECNALVIQYISGDLNELESRAYSESDPFGIDWPKAERLSQAGTIGGNIYKGDDGRVYFYLGH